MKRNEAISIAITTLDTRAQQWDAAAVGPVALEDCINELYEADTEEAEYMANLIREAIQTLKGMRK